MPALVVLAKLSGGQYRKKNLSDYRT